VQHLDPRGNTMRLFLACLVLLIAVTVAVSASKQCDDEQHNCKSKCIETEGYTFKCKDGVTTTCRCRGYKYPGEQDFDKSAAAALYPQLMMISAISSAAALFLGTI